MIPRYTTAIVLGFLVTLGVLFTMHILIATPKSKLDESGTRHFVDFVRVPHEEVLQRKDRRPDKPTQPDAPPPEVIQPRVDAVDPTQVSVGVPIAPVQVDMDLSVGGIGLVASDGDYQPLVKIAPVYPMIARDRGIEGYCLVEYTVTAAGTTKDVVVIESEPKGIFDKVSIEAALKFKYLPRVVNGEPIEVRGVQNIFRFNLLGPD
jgi:protein TonB